MSPACKKHLDMMEHFYNCDVYVLQDWGERVFVLIDPADRGPIQPLGNRGEVDAWKRIDKPTVVLVDPARAEYPRVVN